MTVEELIKELQAIKNKQLIVYGVCSKNDHRKNSFNHRSSKLNCVHEYTGNDMGYEHMKGIFLEGVL